MQYLKADTATTIRIGPFVDDTDGKTAETALTIAQADVRLSKGGAAAAQKNDATSATHDENGYYRIPLNATDTNTEGTLDVCVNEAGALPVIAKFTVLPAEVYDSLIAGTDKLQIDIVQVTGTSVTNVDDFKADLTSLNDPTAAAVATAVRSELTTELGRIDATVSSRAATGDAMTLTSGERGDVANSVWGKDLSLYATADQAGTLLKTAEANTEDLKATTVVKANVVQISGDSAAADNLESYCDGTTPIPANTTQVAGSSVASVADFRADVSGLPSAGTIADAVWDEALSGHTNAGSAGKALADVETDATAILTDTGTTLPAQISGLNDPTAAAVATAVRSELTTELARIDADVSSRAATGAAMTLTTGERDAVAAALLDLANGVETGITTRQALRATLAALAGKVSGMDTNAPVFRAGDDSKDRITATTDANGNRSAVTLNLT